MEHSYLTLYFTGKISQIISLNALHSQSLSLTHRLGGDSEQGIATRYGLIGPEIESLWTTRFSIHIQVDCDHPLPSSLEVKERIQLYLN